MRRIFWLLLIVGFLSLHSQEQEEAIFSENSLNDLAEEPLLSIEDLKKNRLYFLLPLSVIDVDMDRFLLPGLSFRRNLNKDFLEVSYFSRKHTDIILTRYKEMVQSREKLGAVYGNMFNVAYGFKWNTRVCDTYLSLGTGLYFPYMRYEKTAYVNASLSRALLPAISTALGLSYEYGFVDFLLNYFPIKLTSRVEYQEPGYEFVFKRKWVALVNLRIGLGFPF